MYLRIFQRVSMNLRKNLAFCGKIPAFYGKIRYEYILNESSPPIDSLSNACDHWGGCGETDRCPLRRKHPMLLAIVGPEESIRMGKKKCHNAIALPHISGYLADASTNLGLVATVAGLMV
jgi:hypothetical protein